MDIKDYLVTNFGFKQDGSRAWGEINSHGIISSSNDNYITLKISYYNLEDNQDVKELLQNYEDENRISSFSREEDGVNIFINRDKKDMEYLGDLMKEFTRDLEKLQLGNTCSNCRKESSPEFIKLNNTILNSCSNCIQKLETAIYLKNNRPNNYIYGFIGALLGALIGSSLWIGVGVLGYVTSFGGFVIGFASVKGYEILGGKKTKVTAAIILISILTGVFFAEYVGVMIASFKLDPQWTIPLWISQTPYLFIEDNLLKDMLPSIGLGLVFAALGSWRLLKELFSAQEVEETLKRI